MLEIRYHDTHMRYVTFPYTTEAGPSLPLLPHPAVLRAHVRTRLHHLYGRQRLSGRLRQQLAALFGAALGWPPTMLHLSEGQDFWAAEIACLRLMVWRMQRCLCLQAPHLTWVQAYAAILPMLQTGYDYGLHWRRRPWLQLTARCWN